MSDQQLAPTRAQFRSLRECSNLGEAFNSPEFMDRIKQSAPAHIKPSRMLRTFIQAASRTPSLLKCNMRSVLGAMLTCSEVGLEPNTPLQHAFLIPFEKFVWNKITKLRESAGHEVQLIFGYPGLLDLSYRSGQVTSVHADVVWKADEFSFEYGTEAHLKHVPKGQHADGESPLWAYAHASLKNGQAFGVMPWADVLRIRNSSQGFRAALAAKERGQGKYVPAAWTEAPWVRHESAMASKTAFRSLAKWLPKSVELAGAMALDELQDRNVVDFGAVLDGDASISEGGFQELGSLDDDSPVDSGSAFGFRDEPKTPAPPPKAPQQPIKSTATQPATESIPAARQSAPTTDVPVYWLIDQDGSPIELHGGSGRFTDPVIYAEALVAYLDDCFPADRDSVEHANSEDAERAALASEAAAAIFRRPNAPAATTGPAADPVETTAEPERDPLEVPRPLHDNTTTWTAWLEIASKTLEGCTAPVMLDHFATVNEPVYSNWPHKWRLVALKLIDDRRRSLASPPPREKPADDAATIRDRLLREIDICTTFTMIDALSKNAETIKLTRALKALDPEEFAKVWSFAADKRATFAEEKNP